LQDYEKNLSKLTSQEQDRVLQALENQNRISELLSCLCDCEAISDLPQSIREPTQKLFSFAFDLLGRLGIRDRQYDVIYNSITYTLCPFCGCEHFDAPGAPREHLDHFLVRDHYPFAAANLRNLVPMGAKCNSSYKKAKDILRNVDGARRRAFDPYNHNGLQISLENSEPFAGSNGLVPQWQIEFNPNTEETATWDEVFQVRERYERDVLNLNYRSWLGLFQSWCRSASVAPTSTPELVTAIERYTFYLEAEGLNERAFLKAAMFRMLCRKCREGNYRVIRFLMDLAN
jgi:hypothetical protein